MILRPSNGQRIEVAIVLSPRSNLRTLVKAPARPLAVELVSSMAAYSYPREKDPTRQDAQEEGGYPHHQAAPRPAGSVNVVTVSLLKRRHEQAESLVAGSRSSCAARSKGSGPRLGRFRATATNGATADTEKITTGIHQ